jgi:predicted nucleic acid-binding protein
VIHFLDSSALVKRYVRERGSDVVAALFRGRKELAVARIAELEVNSAFAKRVRAGDLELGEAQRHALSLGADVDGFHVVELRPPVLQIANALVWRRALRAYDALQLAAALRLTRATGLALTFWCSDAHLCEAAVAEGLRSGAV